MNLTEVFGNIYENAIWGDGTSIPKSGDGSYPHVAAPYVAFVQRILAENDVNQVLDLGHGDWSMWPEDAFVGFEYQGIDVARGLSEEVMKKLGNQRRNFQHGDIRTMHLPNSDLVLCKDVLQHLSNDDVDTILNRIKHIHLIIIAHDVLLPNRTIMQFLKYVKHFVAFKYRIGKLRQGRNPLRITIPKQNHDIRSGGYRALDFENSPWSFSDYGLKILESQDFAPMGSEAKQRIKRIWLLSQI